MKGKGIKNIFFDLDHTLWDFDKNSKLAFAAIFKKNAISINLENFIQAYTPINSEYWKLYRNDQISKADLRFNRLYDCFTKLGIEVEREMINTLAEEYIEALPVNNHLLDGAKEVLDYLSSKYELHIITNGFEEVQNLKLKKAEIENYFQTVTTSEKAGVKKPHPGIFRHALLQSGAKVESSLMIGDNMEADILGAQKIGMQTILFNYYHAKHGTPTIPCLSVDHLSHLYKHL